MARATIDLETVRERYRAERDKRLRPDGIDQYVEVRGEFERYSDDPTAKTACGPPVIRDVEVLVIGAGIGGLLSAVHLVEAGVDDVLIVDKAADFGGTWYWNRYPGVRCDVDAYVYVPLLEQTGVLPTEKYASGPEIHASCRRVAELFDLRERALFGRSVTRCQWSDDAKRWLVSTQHGDDIRARFICLAIGPMSKPKLPGIPGIDTFVGRSFHTSRWDYAYTGGDSSGGLAGLRDKRVGIIGTGASAVQCVPHLGRDAGHLYVFQRTPSPVDALRNRPTDPAWAATLGPGWQRQRMENFNDMLTGEIGQEDLVDDGWSSIVRRMHDFAMECNDGDFSPEGIKRTIERADYLYMQRLRDRIDGIVVDRSTAEALKPWYRHFCKRPLFHDGYYETFNLPNVTLVDTAGKGVDRIVAEGVVVDGVTYPLDCLVFATGFEVGTAFERRAGFETVGRHGARLGTPEGDAFGTLHGLLTPGFPNCFTMRRSQSARTTNWTHLLNEQATHIAYVVAQARSERLATVEADPSAARRWVERLRTSKAELLDVVQECTPSYFNDEGQPNLSSARSGHFEGQHRAFFDELAAWRADGTLEGLRREYL